MPQLQRRIGYAILAAAVLGVLTSTAIAQAQTPQPKTYPWSGATLSPDARADMVRKELTLCAPRSYAITAGGSSQDLPLRRDLARQ